MLGHYGHTGTTMEDSVGEVEAQTKYYQRTDICMEFAPDPECDS